MNSPSSSIIRQKAVLETVFEMNLPSVLLAPRQDGKGNFYVCSQIGDIITFDEKGNFSVSLNCGGQPTCMAFEIKEEEGEPLNITNSEKNTTINDFYYADVANSVIYEKKEDEPNVLIKDYQGNPLKGPTSIAYNIEDNSLFFCDAGYFESTSLSRPFGSLFHVDLETKIATPLLLNCLAYPADIFYDNLMGLGYVTETFANRILRISQSPPGFYHVSVFYVFNGRVGPTAVACDDEGNIYVARYEYQNKEGDVDGLISVLNKDGYLVGELIIPKMPEIIGMYIPRPNTENSDVKVDSYLYFTERNFKGVQRIKITGFKSEIDKTQDNYKIY